MNIILMDGFGNIPNSVLRRFSTVFSQIKPLEVFYICIIVAQLGISWLQN